MTSTAATLAVANGNVPPTIFDAAARAIRGGGRNGFVQRNGNRDANARLSVVCHSSRPSRRIARCGGDGLIHLRCARRKHHGGQRSRRLLRSSE